MFLRNISNKLYFLLPVLIVGLFVSTSEVSYFKLSFAYINLALSLLAPISILLNVEFPKIKVLSRDKLAENFKKVTLYSLGLSIGLTGLAILASPFAFKILYGDSYSESIKYIYGLFIYGGLMGLGVALGPMWRAINKVKVSIIINLITLGLGIPLGLLLIKNMDLWGAIIMVTSWLVVSHVVSFIYIINELRSSKYKNG